MDNFEVIREKVKNALIKAASTFREDQEEAYCAAIKKESIPRARWTLECIVENAQIAQKNKFTLCDDTGIPHLLLELGPGSQISTDLFDAIHEGVALGLRSLPGRPMAINGNEVQRLDQTGGLFEDPGAVVPAPLIVKRVAREGLRLHILLLGGGPEIRAKTQRVFHKHQLSIIVDEIVNWGLDEVAQLGCTPCVPAVGIGRTHFEATSLMLEAMVYGNFNIQNAIEQEITSRINESNVGPLGLSGGATALATFMKVGPQRASGVRIVSLRLCCCIEPRIVSIEL